MFASTLSFTPRFSFKLAEDELRVLRTMSAQHYDRVCQQASKQGGTIFGFMNACYNFNPYGPDQPPFESKELGPLTFREVDTLAKICEGSSFLRTDGEKIIGSTLGVFFGQALRAMNDHVPDEIPARTFLPKYAEASEPVATPEPKPPLGAISAVHAAHCCKCGCKYGDENCPVVAGHVIGLDCEDCEDG